MKIDEKDRAVIKELIKNSRQTTAKISKLTGLPMTTVHNRVKKLRKMGVIINYTVNLNYKKLGRPILAYILISVEYKSSSGKKIRQTEIADKIKKVDGIQDVSILAGGADIIAKVLATDIDDLNRVVTEKLRNIEGVDKTQTMIVLSET